ncbi:11001_t:CDS:2, partial [Funneliformis geosporum]
AEFLYRMQLNRYNEESQLGFKFHEEAEYLQRAGHILIEKGFLDEVKPNS